jgi:DNA-binding LacI/PurR family transcriptional regulator
MSGTAGAGSRLKQGRSSAGLAAQLRQGILSGKVAAGGYLPTERELAERHGVAGMTARRALKALEADGLIVAEPRRGYRVMARAHDPGRGAPLAYVLAPHPGPELWDDLHRALLAGFQQAASARGWTLLAVGCEGLSLEQVVEQLRAARVCGAILDTPGRELIDAVLRAGMPAITVDDWREDLEIDSVVQDGFRGGLLAGKWLAERGRRRIGWIGPVGVSRQGLERFGGASAALAGAGIELPPEMRVVLDDPEAPEGVTGARRLLSRKNRPDAMLALWQGCTASLAKAARELGLVPGRDFEMVGWSTEEDYERTFLPNFNGGPVPPAVVWKVGTLARTAIARLAELRSGPAEAPTVIKIPTKLKLVPEK